MRILVIEDNEHIRNNLIEMLKLEDHDVLEAEDGQEGLAIAIEQTPYVIFCDMMMPKMDGLEVLQHIRQHDTISHTPIIFITARTEKATIEQGLAMGADGYMIKPFTVEGVINILKPYQKD